jgi:hypothetical protein
VLDLHHPNAGVRRFGYNWLLEADGPMTFWCTVAGLTVDGVRASVRRELALRDGDGARESDE